MREWACSLVALPSAAFCVGGIAVYFLYIDESGDTEGPQAEHFVLGAAALFEGGWTRARLDIVDLLARHFPNGGAPEEIHCVDVRGGKKQYRKWSPQQRNSLLDDFCARAVSKPENELHFFGHVTNKRWWKEKNPGKNGQELYVLAFENLVSRFNYFLIAQHKAGRPSKGAAVVDFSRTDLSTALKSGLHSFRRSGTRWLNAIHNVIETVMFLDSHESPGLQLADLCAYSLWRLTEFDDARLARQISTRFVREPLISLHNPGKWHGIKYYGDDPKIFQRMESVWPGFQSF